jgi:hypothetical protein
MLPKSFIPDTQPSTGLPKSFVPDSEPQKQGVFSEMGQNLKKAWDTATAPQDFASLGIGGGAIANAVVNTPFKHAVGATLNLPGVKQAVTPFATGMEMIKSNPVHQAISKQASGLIGKVKEKHPRGTEALGGWGDMVKAGLTVSSIGQGINAIKNKIVAPQQVKGVQNTLTQNLGVDPTDAKGVSSVLDDLGATSYISHGNYDAAKWMVENAKNNVLQTIQGGNPTPALMQRAMELDKASRFVEGLKAVPFNPTALSKVGSMAGSVARGTGGLLRGYGKDIARFGPWVGGGGLLYNYLTGKK